MGGKIFPQQLFPLFAGSCLFPLFTAKVFTVKPRDLSETHSVYQQWDELFPSQAAYKDNNDGVLKAKKSSDWLALQLWSLFLSEISSAIAMSVQDEREGWRACWSPLVWVRWLFLSYFCVTYMLLYIFSHASTYLSIQPAVYKAVGPPGAQVSLEQQAYMLLTEPERQTMVYYLQEYQEGHIGVEPLAMALFELFNTHAKVQQLQTKMYEAYEIMFRAPHQNKAWMYLKVWMHNIITPNFFFLSRLSIWMVTLWMKGIFRFWGTF